jgi:hypothetical protein
MIWSMSQARPNECPHSYVSGVFEASSKTGWEMDVFIGVTPSHGTDKKDGTKNWGQSERFLEIWSMTHARPNECPHSYVSGVFEASSETG